VLRGDAHDALLGECRGKGAVKAERSSLNGSAHNTSRRDARANEVALH
jgi:hypothetical protein